jgi:hypothetical protein
LCREIGDRGRADAGVAGCDDVKVVLDASSMDASSSGVAPLAGPDASLRAALAGLRLKELRAQARREGVGAEAMEAAADSDDPKQAVIELLAQRKSASRTDDAQTDDALRHELSSLRLKELRLRARRAGIGEGPLDSAADEEDPKAAMVELLLAAR